MLKIGVVGIGHMGRYHVNLLSTLEKARLISICDADEARVNEMAASYGIKGFTDYKKFLRSVDAVVIAVPTFLHYKFASEAVEAGKHVLVEKPITKTLYYAEKLIEQANKKGVFLQVGHVERFNAAVQALEHIVQNPYLIQAQRLGPRSRIQDVGVVLDLMIHDIDIALNIADSKVADISAYGQKIYSNFEDIAQASIYFENGVIADISASRVTENKVRTLAISQEKGYVFLDYATQDITISRQPQSEYLVAREEIRYTQESLVERVFIHKDNALRLELKHFVECIKEDREPIRHPEADVRALKIAKEIMDKIYIGWDKNNG